MKKIIVTICSLALSVAGTLGVNQLSLNNNDAINTNSDNTAVVQYADKAEEQNSMTADSKTDAATAIVKEAVADAEVAAPITQAETKSEAKETAKAADQNQAAQIVTTDTGNSEVLGVNNTAPATKKAQASKVKKTKAPQKAVPVSSNASKTAVQNTTKAVPVSSKSNNAFVYKNVDLSQCNNTQEVVKVLQQNGFRNINLSNVTQIASLKDILALVNGGNNSNTATPAPTKAPAPTTKPVQTTPTQTPAPTTKPVQTAPAPTKAPVNNTNTGINSYADQVLQLVNQERAKAGLSALTTNSTLKAAADVRAQETVQSFSHTRPNGTTFSTVFKEFGISYRTSGENIAYGQKTPQEVVTAWMNSPGHRANIMNANFGKLGIGVYQKNGVIYWSQLFTN